MTKTRIKSPLGHGGVRTGAGRPFRPLTLFNNTFLGEKIIVKRFSHGQYRRHKTTRIQIILDRLFVRAMNGDLKAIDAYLNVVCGKPPQERLPSEEDPMEMVSPFLQLNEILEKAYPDTDDQEESRFDRLLDEKLKKLAEDLERESNKKKTAQDIPLRTMPPEGNISEKVFDKMMKRKRD